MAGLIKSFTIMALLTLAPAAEAATESLSYRLALPQTRGPAPEWGRDPFIPGVRRVSAPDLRLSAVFYGRENPSAIINDRIVYRGSIVGGQKVVDIGVTHVILKGDRGSIRLELADIPELHNGGRQD